MGVHQPGPRSRELMQQARKLMPGGVSSPVRAFRAVGGEPLFIERGEGCRLYDADGREYTDCLSSWGAVILGHADPSVTMAARQALEKGSSFGACTPGEVELARKIVDAVPGVEMVRFVSSGTEAVMSAVRLARAFTGRTKVIKFEGGYHGHSDGLLSKAGSGLATFGIPESPGVPASFAAETMTVPYNDLQATSQALASLAREVACVLVEPVAGNMGVVLPAPGFLDGLRRACDEHGALLLFDEVITGFRVGLGGAQRLYGVIPDITTMGKVIGGGFPLAAYGGRREIMERVAPAGDVYQAGTLSGNPVAVAAGSAALDVVRQPGFYERLEELGAMLERGMRESAAKAGCRVTINRVGSMVTIFFCDGPVTDFASAARSDAKRFAAFFHAMLDAGVYFPPSRLESAFLCAAHTPSDIERIISASKPAFRAAA